MTSCGMIYIQSFIKIGAGIQAKLRCLRKWRGCNVGIIDENELWSTPLRWAQMSWYTYQFPWRSVQIFKQRYGYYGNDLRDYWCYWSNWLLEYSVKMVSRGTLYLLSFIKIGAGVQTILKFRLRKLRCFNMGITYYLCSDRWNALVVLI
jgi:hypothetical protein